MIALGTRVDTHGMPITPATFPNDESGIIPLIAGQDYIDIVFTEEKTNLLYFPVDAVEYTGVGDPPDKIFVTTRVKATTGYRAWLNAAPSDGNYRLKWRIRA